MLATRNAPAVSFDDTLKTAWEIERQMPSFLGREERWEVVDREERSKSLSRARLKMFRAMHPERTYRLVEVTVFTKRRETA